MNFALRAKAALVAVALLLWPIAADAQLSKVGAPFVTPGGASAYSRTSDTAYDSTHQVFLTVVSEHNTAPGGRINASFADTNGTVLTSAFRVDSTGSFPFGPALAYSPEADVFLVVWTVGGGQVRGRLVRYGVNALAAADFALSGPGVASGGWAPAVAYSPTSQEFLVVYSKGGTGVTRVSTAGGIIGQAATVSAALASGYHWTQDPAVTWNSANNEFLLTYAQELSPGWQIRAQRISAGQAVGGPVVVQQAGSTKMPDVQYSALSAKYLVTWFQSSPYGIYGRMLNADASAAGSPQPMLPSNYGSYDANSLGYNSFSNTFAVATITPQSVADVGMRDTIGGAQISTAAVPSTAMRYVEADSGNRFFPEIDGSSTNNRFLVSFNKSHATFYGQLVAVGEGGSAPPPPPPPPTSAAAITAAKANFGGSSGPDLLWRHQNGAVAMWTMSGLTAVASTLLGPGPVDPAWRLAGTGDLNGDGKPEIVWQHLAGWLSVWYMNGPIFQSAQYLAPNRVENTAWKVAAIADINGDLKADLIWQHDQGWLAVWYMNGATQIGSAYLNPSSIGGNGWKIVGAGDLNGDLKPDLVWQHTSTNGLSAWIMNGVTATSTVLLNPNQVQAGWRVRAVVDLNADGKCDLVWRHDNGSLAVWLMQGTTAAAMTNVAPGVVGLEWDLAGPR